MSDEKRLYECSYDGSIPVPVIAESNQAAAQGFAETLQEEGYDVEPEDIDILGSEVV